MTREEAIKTLKGEAWLCCAEKWNEALNMAIKALEQGFCPICGFRIVEPQESED